MNNTNNNITPIAFTALTISSIFTTSNLPTLATSGGHLIFYLILTAILFFIPLAIVVAGLSTTEGYGTNVFSWINYAFGNRIGLASTFWEWLQAIVMSIPMLYFVTGTFSYALSAPEMNSNSLYKALVCIFFYLFLVCLQITEPKFVIKIEAFGFWVCVIGPLIISFILGLIYILKVQSLPFSLNERNFIPSFKTKETLLTFVPFVLSLTGVEACGPFISKLKNINKDFPKAILIVIVTVIFTNLIGSSSIAMIFPANKIDLSTGFINAVDFLFRYFGIPLVFARLIAFFIVLGLLPKVSNWIISPALALQNSAADGLLPKYFIYENSIKTPTHILCYQSFLFVLLALLLSLSKSGNTAFLVAIYLDVAIYSCVYIFIFLSYIKLTFKNKNSKDIFNIPIYLKRAIGFLALFTMFFILVASFLPPSSIPKDEINLYLGILITCFTFVILIPFIFQIFYKNKKAVD
ncbi:APC family permease [Candidatus Cetobacterium colombiensis]|uniref:APC family permease n=1 Tax=Candidatus Cetobacterium colombiensis TaxID=3073100 RepID=A0ABU4W9J9_9FUSO|nr:APC family permease [Candidatus Cetobacterium colombiensis]MDX8336193.1 APC family permease [Candidatus Cetobacterium colombiensis]